MKNGEESMPAAPLDRPVEQAIVSIKKGAYLLKGGRRGKPKLCHFRLSPDEKILIWYSGQQEKHLQLSAVTKIIQEQGNIKSQRQNQPEEEIHSFSLIYANGERSLDLICKDRAQAASWLVGLRAVISRLQHPRSLSSLRSGKEVQSCVSSPAGIFRRKKNLGLLKDTSEFTQVHSPCASPTLSLSERCFSEGLLYASDSFYSSEPFLYNTQRVTDISVPSSPYVNQNFINKSGSPHIGNSNVLKDVMVWGGEIGGSGNNRFVNQHHVCTLLPKLLESTVMLDVQNIALGGKHAALVTKQGELFCWGQGKGGRLGHKIDIDVSSPKIIDSLNSVRVKYAACGEYHTCALTDAGVVYTWGNSGCTDSGGYERNKSQWIPQKLLGPLDGVRISSVSCGEWHTAIVSCCGRLFTYGDGTFGVLGHGNLHSVSQPKQVESLRNLRVRSVACGSWHTAAIVEVMVSRFRYNTSSGKLFTWGDGDEGRLGHADGGRKLLPTCVQQLVDYDFVQVSCGRMLTVALTNLGKVFTMGSMVHGQLGNSFAKDNNTVTLVEGQLKQEFVKEISSGSYHVAVLTSSGSVYTWGKGTSGQLGLGDTEDRYLPSFVEALKDRQIESIACGSCFTAAICLHKPVSIADQSACSDCKLPFGFRRKKHNCYNCGLVFCHSCSTNKVTKASLAPNRSKAFRVCDQCFNKCHGVTHSPMASKSRNYDPHQLLKHQNKFSDLSEDRGETTLTPGPLLSLSQSCYMKSMPSGRKDWKNQQESQKHLENVSSVLGGVPQWGQVSCPALFKTKCTENSFARVSSSENQLSSANLLNFESTVSSIDNAENDMPKSDKLLVEEVQRLRAEARRLEEQCKLKNYIVQECHQKIEEAMLLAREEAAKCKAAKEVIKALASKLHTISGKANTGQEGKVSLQECLPYLSSIHSDIHTPKDCNLDSLSSSPIVFSDKVKSKFGRSMFLQSDNNNNNNKSMEDDSHLTGVESHEDSINKGSKFEWVEQYDPGVYITLTTLPCGQKGLKRVRFSRKRFSEKEAERWWEENQERVHHKYEIEEYINSKQ